MSKITFLKRDEIMVFDTEEMTEREKSIYRAGIETGNAGNKFAAILIGIVVAIGGGGLVAIALIETVK